MVQVHKLVGLLTISNNDTCNIVMTHYVIEELYGRAKIIVLDFHTLFNVEVLLCRAVPGTLSILRQRHMSKSSIQRRSTIFKP